MRDLFAQLDEYLTGPYQIDTWAESSVDVAEEIIRAFDEPAWEKLESTWPDRPEDWQVRLADTAFGADPRRGIPLLVEMVKRGTLPVAIIAAENLEGRDDVYTPDASILPYLRGITRQVDRQRGQCVEDLIARAKLPDS